MTRKQLLLSSVVAFTAFVSTVAVAGPIENYSPVTEQRLVNPEPENWLMYARQLQGLGVQPAGADQRQQREEAGAGLELLHRRELRPPGAAHRQQRRDVRHTPYSQVFALDAKHRRPALAIQARAAEGSAPCTPPTAAWRCTGTRSILAALDAHAGRARRQDRQGRLGHDGRGLARTATT